jgi:hypothetical protein
MSLRTILLSVALGALVDGAAAQDAPPNQVVGTWRMVTAEIERDGAKVPAYG